MSDSVDQIVPPSPRLFPLLPLRDIVIFPYMVVPLFVGRKQSIGALEKAADEDKMIFLISQIDPKVDNPEEDDLYRIGTVGKVVQLLKLPDGTVKVLVEGVWRGHMSTFL
ncbi:MAG: LON peptidase substrate-binding domain-containing protein, partial [Deltaproteobacteria bacterium]|nr:LON peptidase substrate-binding domain-containing protein [Deltaproteobacteria bacterium]